jgi:hypothetical protein
MDTGVATDRLDERLTRFVKHSTQRGFTLDDLARVAVRAELRSLTDLVDWLARARSSGLVEDVGFDPLPGAAGPGPRRYRRRDAEAEGASPQRAAAGVDDVVTLFPEGNMSGSGLSG